MKIKFYQLLLGTIGKFMPVSYRPLGKFAKRFRYFCTKRIVKEIGYGCNIEKGAMVAHDVIIEDHGGVGVNCSVPPMTRIGKHVMMGPDVMIYTANHKFNKEKLGLILSAIAGTITNTAGVLGLTYILAMEQFATLKEISSAAVAGALGTIAVSNGIPECIVAVMIVVPVCLALFKLNKRR